ncbi:MAG: UvrD-helicase domain-containing protein [Burkholderiales bacterium]|jgi:DNA helicase-2/ATP-dependent DNA helicase PcrA|nr:UvrD-helicase domain-containing protein [Burkholderiales bacterium]
MNSKSTLLDGLNREQREAVTLPDVSALILAGAGSGKTRVLTTRIAWLLSQARATPKSILAVTFTNKAAREMLARLSVMTSYSTRGVWVGTFHGLCNRLLRAHHKDANLNPLFQILDTADQLSLIKRLYREHAIDVDRYPHKNLQYFIQNAKERGERPHQMSSDHRFDDQMIEYYSLYEAMCEREGVVDFGELMLRSVELLTRNTALREHYQQRFSHVFVDEFQDTNEQQYRWLHLLRGERTSVFAVGDDDQSIYAFRGANSGNMQRFSRDFKLPDHPVKIIKLEQNYRSYSNILNAANALIENNESRMGKNLWTDLGKGEPICAYKAFNEEDEARFVIRTIKEMNVSSGALSDIAILYRSNAQSRALEHALFSAGLPYRVYGGQRFFERAEIKHALAYLRLILSGDDEGAILRVINFPPRGIGARGVEHVQETAKAQNVKMWQVMESGAALGRSGGSIAAFVQIIQQLKEDAKHLSLPDLIGQMLKVSGLEAHYRAEREGEERVRNLSELVQAAHRFVEESNSHEADESLDEDEPLLTRFLTQAALEAGDTQTDAGSALQLMTVHAAKGLEFDTVFVTGLEEGLFPHKNSLGEMQQGLEEERRLMYVAITRAQRRLFFSLAQTRRLNGQTSYNVASRFIAEVPAEFIYWLSLKPSRGRAYDDSYEDEEGDYRQSLSYDGKTHPKVYYGHSNASGRGTYDKPKNPSGARPKSSSALAGGLRIGSNVQHAKFGAGVILDAEGQGSDARVLVSFEEGEKWLSLAYTTLTRLDT